MRKTTYTTGEAAVICEVAPRTISKWFDAGRLRGYRIPGSQDRRIPRESLIAFLKENGMAVPDELVERFGVLAVGVGQHLLGRIRAELPGSELEFRVEFAANGFEAGMKCQELLAKVVIIDLSIGRCEAVEIARQMRRHPGYAEATIVALAPEDDAHPEWLRQQGFTAAVQHPFDAMELVRLIDNANSDPSAVNTK